MKLGELGEFGLIERIAGRVPRKKGVTIGIGDDAAVIQPAEGLLSLVTTDMLVEGVHFDLSLCDPITLGRKSLSVNLSDIAAMGGIPRHFLLSLAIPRDVPVEFLDAFIEGMLERAEQFGVALIGGDTSSSPAGLVISITVIGEQSPDLIVKRSGARPGDLICVTGTLGDAALGLALLKAGKRDGAAIIRQLDPLPRVREGMKLAEAGVPSAMIDISDGLLADLGHILERSGTGARLYLEKLPISEEYREKQPLFKEEFFSFPLSGGEDYELLFTTPPGKLSALESIFAEPEITATIIGEITHHPGLTLLTSSGIGNSPQRMGFNHFSRD